MFKLEWFRQVAIGRKVILNVQTRSVQSSVAAKELLGSAVMVGVMAKDYPRHEDGVAYIRALHEAGIQVSAGLGDGNSDQWEHALNLALATTPAHLNQIFPAAALSHYALSTKNATTLVNAMIRPTGQPGVVNLGTGPLSQSNNQALVPVDAAVSMLKEMGIRSLKFFPIDGIARLDEVRVVAKAVAAANMMLEPTGGITPDNVGEIVRVCLEEDVSYIMPHLYGSLKDPMSGDLDLKKLKTTFVNVEQTLKDHER